MAFQGRKTAAARSRPGERPPSGAHPRGLPGHGTPSTASRAAAHSPAVKDQSTYSGAQRPARGSGGTLPPHGPPAYAHTASGTRVHCLSPRTRRIGIVVRSPCCSAAGAFGGFSWKMGVKGRAIGARGDRAPLRLAPEEAVTPPPATMAPAGPCMPKAHPTYAVASTRWSTRADTSPRHHPTSVGGLALMHEPDGVTWRASDKERGPDRGGRETGLIPTSLLPAAK